MDIDLENWQVNDKQKFDVNGQHICIITCTVLGDVKKSLSK